MPNEIKTTDQSISIDAPPAMVIPFSGGSSNVEYAFNPYATALGQSGDIYIAAPGFGVLSNRIRVLTGLDETTKETRQYFYSNNQNMFGSILTKDISHISIYMDVTISSSLTPVGTDYYPYVALAMTSSPSNNMFEIIPETITSITLDNGTTYTSGTMQSASQTFIPVNFKKGTRMMVICGFTTSDPSSVNNTYSTTNLNFSGGIALY